MTLEEKRSYILENKEPYQTALESYLDYAYNLEEEFNSEKFEKTLSSEQLLEKTNVMSNIKILCGEYEKILSKLKKNTELSMVDIARIVICLQYCREKFLNNIENLQRAEKEMKLIILRLMS